MTTFDTGRLQIGIRHFRPMPAIYGDMLAIQKALMEKRIPTVWSWLVCKIYRWL